MTQGPGMRAKRFAVQTTVLLVGEGYAEVAFLKHLKSLYVTRGNGVSVQIFNSYGKGAANVVNVAVKHSQNATYDRKGALLDTDTDWTGNVSNVAKRAGIEVIASSPCLEATLLRIKGISSNAATSSKLKKRIQQELGLPANDKNLYERQFDRATLEIARARVSELDSLIKLISP